MALELKKEFYSTWEVNNAYAKICMVIYNDDWTKDVVLKYFFNKEIRDNNGHELNRENIKVLSDIWDSREDLYNHLKTLPNFTNVKNI